MGEGRQNKLDDNTLVIEVYDFELALCLASIGVPLREDPPYVHAEMGDGTERWKWLFRDKTADGKASTQELIKAWVQGEAFTRANPEHPLTIARCTLRNRETFVKHMSNSVPRVTYLSQSGQTELSALRGSKRHKLLKANGLKQCDPGTLLERSRRKK